MTNINTSIADEHSLSARVKELSRSLRLYDTGLTLEPQGVWGLCCLLDDMAGDAARLERELIALRSAALPAAPPCPRPLLHDIIGAVAAETGVSRDAIMSDDRHRTITHARQITYWMVRELTALSCLQIGRRMMGRNHATVLHGVRQIDHLAARDPKLRRRLDKLAERLVAEAAHIREQAA